jgi:DNA-directed RNA polymerase subunit M/transcription elongation factor TFIIS
MEQLRNIGTESLKTIILKEKNVSIIENSIYQSLKDSSDFEYEYKECIYQTLLDLENGLNIKECLQKIKAGKTGWDNEAFLEMKKMLDEQDEFIQNPFEVVEGVLECKCGNKKIFSYSKQTRSADEPMTTFAQCTKCKAKWSYSG